MPQVAFSILLALSLKPRHGYEIMKQVEQDSAGRVKMGPGALYGTVKQLLEDALVEEEPHSSGQRRRYYKLTKKGWQQLTAELKYLEEMAAVGRQRRQVESSGEATWAV